MLLKLYVLTFDRFMAGTKTQNVAKELRLITNFVRIGAFL